jgi:hypothetical protein
MMQLSQRRHTSVGCRDDRIRPLARLEMAGHRDHPPLISPGEILRVVLRVLWRPNAVARATTVIRSDRRRAYGDCRGDAPGCAARLLQLIASPICDS